MYGKLKDFLTQELANIKAAGLYKNERIITTPQRADIKVNAGSNVLNFCANNYLGLSDNQRLIKAAKDAMDSHGYGMSSVRFICGTQDLHKELEAAISDYFKTEDTILYAACFDANGGLFEPLFGEEDAIISDALNHASIIDGVRLCKAKRYRYANADMADLERCLQEAQAQRHRIIATDGVFSMDGNVAPMDKICELAEKYDVEVLTMVGFLDGINDSLVEANPIDTMEEDTPVNLIYDKEKLYKNMVDAKADWLYELPQWDAIFDAETKKALYLEQKKSGTIRREGKKVGRNDPCPCGSGKKYKQCCGKNA